MKAMPIFVPKLYARPDCSVALTAVYDPVDANMPPAVMLYGIGESVEMAVIVAVGGALPCTHVIGIGFAELIENFGAWLVTNREIGMGKSPDP